MGKDKPNCYECKHRGSIAGDAHSCCKHPSVKVDNSNMFSALVGLMNGDADGAIKELGITGDSYGIRMGWFMWPANFDPVWLVSCNGFKKKEN
jgi:hypothetical protein